MLTPQEAAALGAGAAHLLASDVNIAAAAGASLAATREVLGGVYARMAPLPVTALELLRRQRDRGAVTTPLPAINAALGGGLPHAIVELTGRAGVGKTQSCLSIVARACTPAAGAAPGTGAAGVPTSAATPTAPPSSPPRGAVYIDSEGTFDGRRFCEVAAAAFPSVYGPGAPGAGEALRALLSRVVVFRVEGWQQLANVVANELEEAVVRVDAAIVVVDSLASAARGDVWGKGGSGVAGAREGSTGGGQLQGSGGSAARQSSSHHPPVSGAAATAERAAALGWAAAQLKALADSFGICVLVVNQVMATMGSGVESGGGDDASAPSSPSVSSLYSLNAQLDEDLTPALGAAWLHFVNTRVFLSPQRGSALGSGLGVMRLVKSPAADHTTAVPYRITAAGIVPHEG